MENMFLWTLVFAGATIGLLATFLIASERELKIKRREVAELENKVTDSQTDPSANRLPDTQAADGQIVAELMARNEELLAQVSSLSDKLEQSQKTTAELPMLQHRLGDYESEQRQLQLANQRLQADLADLNNQLQANATRFNESADETQRVAGHKSQLETQVAELQHKLENAELRVRDLEDARQRLTAAESREVVLRDRQQELEQQVEELRREISAGQQNATQLEMIRSRLQETEWLHQQARGENRRLQEEVTMWQEWLAASEETKRQLATFRQYFGELQGKQASIAESQRQFETDLTALATILDALPSDFSGSSPELRSSANGNIKAHAPESASSHVSQHASAIELARDQINQRRYYDALANLNDLLKDEPNNREAQLHHLLASIHLHGIQSYEIRIDSIKDMADLSESEMITARDIFLLRADAAQKSGQDDEMLRYRAWARNVIYRAPFANANHEAAGPALGTAESNGFPTEVAAMNTAATSNIDESLQQAAEASDNRRGQ